jgi:hypothetical protein
LARNRYGWQKRSKEMARKEKNDEKMKRRQGKLIAAPAEEMPEVVQDLSLGETDSVETLQQDS